jgi:cell division protein FtsW (lipid II flippase)
LIATQIRYSARAFVVCFALSLLYAASSQARDFPRSSQTGRITAFERPFVTIGSKAYQLAPAARIIDTGNRLIQPSTLPVGARVVYRIENTTGFVHDVWLLAPNEVATIRQ